MNASTARACSGRSGPNGFTLFELIFVIALMSLAATTIARMQPRIFSTQVNSRDQYVGLELLRGCAERLVAVRRKLGYANVTNTLCNGLGGVGGFAANPTVVLKDASNATIAACVDTTATCTATITAAKTSGPAASLQSITVQFGSY